MAKLKSIKSYKELKSNLTLTAKTYLLLYKNGSEVCSIALKNITKASQNISSKTVLKTDMSQVKDIHGKYKVNSFPSLLCFEKGKLINVIKGSHDESFYQQLFTHSDVSVQKKEEKKPQKKVIVYSTPDCIWCAKVKKYLRENKIKFIDYDVSKNKIKMYELIKKSGKMGVPQTEIGSAIVVGFDKAKINRLLNIKV